jgi:hypothetical protein
MAVVSETDSAFQNILTQMITYSENRMYRDLDFLFTSGSSTAYNLIAGNRTLNVPAETFPYGTLVVPEQINVLIGGYAAFVGSISGTTLSVGTVYDGEISVGMQLSGLSVVSGTTIVGKINDTTYGVFPSQNATFNDILGYNIDGSERSPLLPTTKEFLDAVYGSGAAANRGLPQYWVPFDDYTFLVGPYPDQSYRVELIGTYRPQSLGYLPPVLSASSGGTIVFSASHGLSTGDTITLYNFAPSGWNASFVVTVTNSTTVVVSTFATTATTIGTAASAGSTTFISLNLPDIMIMASMIYISAYQRNFGRANDDPQMAITYESQYQALLKSAMVEESRKKFEAAGWSSQSPSPVATPTRG